MKQSDATCLRLMNSRVRFVLDVRARWLCSAAVSQRVQRLEDEEEHAE
jgi:hypothetical protein